MPHMDCYGHLLKGLNFITYCTSPWAFLTAPMVKSLPAMWETWFRSPESGRSPGEGNGNSLQYPCVGNPMDRVIWWAIVLGGHTESDTTEGLTQNTFA